MEKREEKIIKCEFKESELFQLHLCVISRSAYATQKWASACSAEEQQQLQSEIAYCTNLTNKLAELLKPNE